MTETDSPEPSPSLSKTVAKSSGIVMGALLLSRVLGLLRDTVQSAQFGVGLDTDAYTIAFQIPDLLFMLIAGGGLSSAFIPVFSEFLHTDREEQAWKVFSVVVTLCSLVTAGLIAAAWFFARPIAAFFARDKEDLPHLLPRIEAMGRILLPAQFAFLIGSLLIATLYARNRFVIPGVAPNVYNAGIILGALLGPALGFGIAGMAWGGLAGAFVGNLLLPAAAMMRLGGQFAPSLDLKTEGVGKFFALLGPVVFGFSLPSVAGIISQYFASPYGAGANTSIRLANNLMQAPLGIFGQSLALAAFPVLTQFYAERKMDKYAQQLNKTLATVLFLSVPSAIFLGVLSPQIVNLLYGYGKAHRPEDLKVVAACLQVYAVGIVAWCLQPVLMRGFFSVHQTLRPVAMSTGVTGLFIVLLLYATKLSGSPILVIPWCANIAVTALIPVLAISLHRTVAPLDWRGLAKSLGQCLVCGLPMLVAGLAAGAFIKLGQPKLLLVLEMFAAFLALSWIYLAMAKVLKMSEAQYVDRGLARFRKAQAQEGDTGTL